MFPAQTGPSVSFSGSFSQSKDCEITTSGCCAEKLKYAWLCVCSYNCFACCRYCLGLIRVHTRCFLSPVGVLSWNVQNWQMACLTSSFTESILGFLLVKRQLGSSPFSTSAMCLMHLLIDHLFRETSFETEEVSLFFFTVSPQASDFIAPKAACPSLFLSCFRTFIAPLKSVAIALNASTSFSSLGDVTNPFSCSTFLVWGLHTRFNIIRFQPFSLAFWVERFWFCPQLSFLPYGFRMRKHWKNFWAFFPGLFSKKLFSLQVLLIFEPAIHLVCSINLNK